MFVRAKRPVPVPAGTGVLEMTIGERRGGYDGRFFVAAVYYPAGGDAFPFVASAPVLVNFATVDEFKIPDQEDSPAATYPGGTSTASGSDGETRDRGIGRDSKSGRKDDGRTGDGGGKKASTRPATRPRI